MRCIVPLLSMVLLFPVSGKADDGIKFFDGYKYGWNGGKYSIFLSKKGEYIYYQVNSTDGDNKLRKNLNKNCFNVNLNSIFNCDDYFISENNGYDMGKSSGGVFFYDHYSSYGLLSTPGVNVVFNFNQESDARLVLIRGKKIKSESTKDPWDQKITAYTYFDYDLSVHALPNGDLLLPGGREPYLYIIPNKKKNKIISRNNLFYAPMRYVANIWRKEKECPPIPFHYSSHSKLNLIDDCLLTIYKKHPRGEFNVDFPDTQNEREFS